MRLIRIFPFSGLDDYASWTRRVLLPMAALLLILSVESLFAKLILRNS